MNDIRSINRLWSRIDIIFQVPVNTYAWQINNEKVYGFLVVTDEDINSLEILMELTFDNWD